MKAALIAAIVAAIVSATAATATTAIVITGAQIKDGSVQAKDLSAKARRSLRGQRGPRGLRGATGAPGAQGPQGSNGANGANGTNGTFDPAKVTVRRGPDTVIPADSVDGVLAATCISGETALSGGWFADVGVAFFEGVDPAKTMYAVAIDNTGNAAGTGFALVVCAAP